MHLLIINHNAGRPDLGYAFRPYYLAREWIKLGHSVTIIGATYSHVRRNSSKAGEEIYQGIQYIWIKTKKYNGNGIGRMIAMFQFVTKIWIRAKRISNEDKIDAVIASSTYPLDIYPARRVAKLSGAKLCFELHDLWPLSPMELGGYSPSHPFIKIMQKAEDYYCKHADKVISIIPLAKDYLVGRGLESQKFYYVPNGVAIEDWTERKPLSPELTEKISKIKGTYNFLVAYAGAHGIANALSVLLGVAEKLVGDNIGVVLIGDGPEKENLKKQVQTRGIQNIFFLESIPKSQIPSLLNQFDALYIGLQKESLFRFGVSPNKIFDYMMAGKPIIQAIDAGNNLVSDANCGVSAEAENADEIAAAALLLKSMSSEERNSLGQNGREFAIKNHTYSFLAKKFLDAISN